MIAFSPSSVVSEWYDSMPRGMKTLCINTVLEAHVEQMGIGLPRQIVNKYTSIQHGSEYIGKGPCRYCKKPDQYNTICDECLSKRSAAYIKDGPGVGF